jgi:branched-chain amino acid transport system ATP-binding protein
MSNAVQPLDTQAFDPIAPLLEMREIDAFYGPIQALRGVSFSVAAGERVALVGANGAGKTTTLRVISGLIAPGRGDVVFGGQQIGGLAAEKVVRRGVAHLPEGRELFSGMSVEENLQAGYRPLRGTDVSFGEQRERVMGYFPILRERRRQAAGTLSGGEQQMLGAARALMSNPKLLLVDELSLGLAPKIVAQLFEILAEVNRDGTAVVIVEQFVHMALANTDRAVVLAKGEVVLEGASAEMLDDPRLIASYLGEAAPEPTPATRARRSTKGANGRAR